MNVFDPYRGLSRQSGGVEAVERRVLAVGEVKPLDFDSQTIAELVTDAAIQ